MGMGRVRGRIAAASTASCRRVRISFLEGGEDPGALPAQALDHSTGYFLAAGILDALTLRSHDGRGRDVDVSLASTGARLLDAPGRNAHPGLPTAPGLNVVVTMPT